MQISCSKYLSLFEERFREVTLRKPTSVVWQYRNDTVFTTWEVSFNALGLAAKALLLLCGFLDNEDISEELLSSENLKRELGIGKRSMLNNIKNIILTPCRLGRRYHRGTFISFIGKA